MADDVVLNKAAGIERCLLRIVAEYSGDRESEISIDLAMYVINRRLV